MFSLYFDGASKGNPGKSGSGYVILETKKEIYSDYHYLGHATNNEAEYDGIVKGLERAVKLKIKKLKVYGDSTLVIKQSSGKWSVKAQNLKRLHQIVKELSKQFDEISFEYIPRANNSKADALANKGVELIL